MAMLLLDACKKEENSTPACTYSGTVKQIVANKCALSGCHASGTAFANLTDFAQLKARADNGRLRQYVYTLEIMPPANVDSLSAKEKEQLKCWLDNGAKQD